MKFFSRKSKAALGSGVWQRSNARFERSLARYHQVLEGISDETAYNQCVLIGNDLFALTERVKNLCVKAQLAAPSESLEIPGPLSDVHRYLSRASNSLATTAEALAFYRLSIEQGHTAEYEFTAVKHRADIVRHEVQEAELIFDLLS